jgi:hypothetical protein
MLRPNQPRSEEAAVLHHAGSLRLNRRRARGGKSVQRCESCAPALVCRSSEIGAPYLLEMHGSGKITQITDRAWFDQNAAKSFLSVATQQVTRLMDLPEPDHRPDEHAHSCAQRMLVHLSDLHFNVAPSDVYADPDSAIRLLWSKGGRNAELVFPSSGTEDPYIYHSDDSKYGVEETLNLESVLNWLNWVLNDITPEHVPAA